MLPIVLSLTAQRRRLVSMLHKSTEANYSILTALHYGACCINCPFIMPTMLHEDTRKCEPPVMRADSDTQSTSLLSCKVMRAFVCACVRELARMTCCACETVMSCSYEALWVIIETAGSDSLASYLHDEAARKTGYTTQKQKFCGGVGCLLL